MQKQISETELIHYLRLLSIECKASRERQAMNDIGLMNWDDHIFDLKLDQVKLVMDHLDYFVKATENKQPNLKYPDIQMIRSIKKIYDVLPKNHKHCLKCPCFYEYDKYSNCESCSYKTRCITLSDCYPEECTEDMCFRIFSLIDKLGIRTNDFEWYRK